MTTLPLAQRLKRAGAALLGVFRPEDMAAAHGLLGGVWQAGGLPPTRTAQAYLDAYSTMPWLRAVSSKVSHSVSTAVWVAGYREESADKAPGQHVYRKAVYDRTLALGTRDVRRMRRKELGSDFREVPNHPLLQLLDAGNVTMTGVQIRQVTQIHLDILGEAFWLFERPSPNALPSRIWPIPPSWVKHTPDGRRMTYEVQHQAWHGEIPASEMLWITVPNPANPYGRGTGIAEALGDELDSDEFAAKTIKAWFYNRARPDITISPKLREGEEPLSTPELMRMKEKWLSELEGFQKSSRAYFSSMPLEIQTISQTFEQMQLIGLREYERNTVLQVFGGVPPELLGIIENSNRATIESADYLYQRHVIEPRLEFLRSVLQARLASVYDPRLVIDYESVVQEDKEYHLKVMQARPEVFQIDEWRECAGKPPLDEEQGQAFMVGAAVGYQKRLDDYAGDALIQPDPVVPPDADAGKGTVTP